MPFPGGKIAPALLLRSNPQIVQLPSGGIILTAYPPTVDNVSDPSFFDPPIRFIGFTLETNVSKDYGTDYGLRFRFADSDSRIFIATDTGGSPPVAWVQGNENDPLSPNQPQWHEDAPISGEGVKYAVAWISNDSGTDNLSQFSFDSPPVSGSYKTINSFPGSQNAELRKNPAGVAHTISNTSTYRIRRVSDSVAMAEAQVTLIINFI